VRNPTISTVIGLHLVRYQHAIKVPARLSYSSEDPYAVHIAFCVGMGEPVEWMVARDLLSAGMWRRAGVGDVTVWPSVGSAAGAPGSVMNIEISSPNGQAHFEAAVKEISYFLRRTYQVVQEGEESAHLDAELTNLLRSASLAHGAPSWGDSLGATEDAVEDDLHDPAPLLAAVVTRGQAPQEAHEQEDIVSGETGAHAAVGHAGLDVSPVAIGAMT
jgi:hypothetical protein